MRRTILSIATVVFFACLLSCRPPISSRPRVLLIGLDGIGWDLPQAMMKAGEAPHFAQLREQGAWGVLSGDEPLPPAAFWTSVATGRVAADHRVTGPIRLDEQTGRLLAPERASSALWEIVARKKIPAGVIGWPGSAPASPDVKTAFDDFAFYRGLGLLAELAGEALPVPARDAETDSFVGRVPRGGRFNARLARASLLEIPPLAVKAWPRLQLLAVYFDGLNSARHYAGAASATGEATTAPEFGKPSRAYVRAVDESLGQVLALADDRTLVLVVSDDPTYAPGRTPTGDFAHPPRGIVALIGANVKAGARMTAPRLLDVVPTALAHLGVAQSAQMPGAPFADVWRSPLEKLAPVASLDAFIRRPYADEGPLRDEGIVRRLQWLQQAADPPREPFDDRNRYALELLAAGKTQGCRSEAQRDLVEHPDNPVGRYLLGETLLAHGRPADALAHFTGAAAQLGNNPTGEPARSIRAVVGLAAAAVNLQQGRTRAAVVELERVLTLQPGNALAVAMSAQCHFALGYPASAASLLENALKLEPKQPALWLLLGRAREQTDRTDEADEAYRTAIRYAPTPPVEAYRRLAHIAVDREQWRKAIGNLRDALETAPDDAAIWLQLARVYQRRQDRDEAEAALLRCLRYDRDDVAAWLVWRDLAQADGNDKRQAALEDAARQSAVWRILAGAPDAAPVD